LIVAIVAAILNCRMLHSRFWTWRTHS